MKNDGKFKSIVSLPFAPRLRFTLIPMDAPPYGIAVFRHYCSRHLICIVPFTRRGPSPPPPARASLRDSLSLGGYPQALPRFICIATHLFVREDSRIRVTPLTACSALRAIPSLRSALTAFGGYVLITSRFVCDSWSFHHDSSAKLVLAYQTLTHSSCLSHLNPDPEEPPPALRGRLHRRPRLEDYNN